MGRELWIGHPIKAHDEISPAASAKAQEFRRGFDPEILQFDSRVRLGVNY